MEASRLMRRKASQAEGPVRRTALLGERHGMLSEKKGVKYAWREGKQVCKWTK